MIKKICAFSFSNLPQRNQKLNQMDLNNYGSLSDVTAAHRRAALAQHQNYKANLPAVEMGYIVRDHQCVVDLFMRHNDWKSIYIESWLNYQKLGFRKFSDYLLLKDMNKYFNMQRGENVGYCDAWPVLKFGEPMQEAVPLRGIKEIINHLKSKDLVQFQIAENELMNQSIQKFINENISNHLQVMFWHPKLTIENVFHTNIDSVNKESSSLRLVAIFHYNVAICFREVFKNLFKILRERERFAKSRENIEKGLKEILPLIEGKQFIGGDKPSHLDFYLFSILTAKTGVKDFQKFLKYDVGGKLWEWVFRMRLITKYDKQRITLL